MKNLASMKVSQIVAQNYKTAKVFTAHGIDFCCNGGIPLKEACQQKEVSLNTLVEKIEQALKEPEEINFSSMPIDTLAQYIVQTHHHYVRTTLPALTTYLTKLCQVHGERHPELFEIKALFMASAQELTQHMAKEEQVLFPYIQALAASVKGTYPLSEPHFGHIQNPISMMQAEHEQEGERFRKIATLSNNYTPPKGACQTYRVAFSVLQEFEHDLHKHIHLENNILFPKATLAFENTLAHTTE